MWERGRGVCWYSQRQRSKWRLEKPECMEVSGNAVVLQLLEARGSFMWQ